MMMMVMNAVSNAQWCSILLSHRVYLIQTLQEKVKQQKDRKLTVYERLRRETIDYIDGCFQ